MSSERDDAAAEGVATQGRQDGLAADGAGAVRQGGPVSGAQRALGQVFARLEAVIEDELAALREGRVAGLDEITRRKSQCLLDLTRLARAINVEALTADEGGEALRQDLIHIKARLADNEATLKRYMEAAREVASLVADGLRASESDGTYAEAGPFGRYGR